MTLSQLTSFVLLISILVFPLIYLVEAIGSQVFLRVFYHAGFTIINQTIEINTHGITEFTGKKVKMRTGKFKFSSPETILFTPRRYLFNVSAKSILPVRVTAKVFANNQLKILAKVPIGSTLFLFCWTFGWLLSSLILTLLCDVDFNYSTFFPVGIGVFLGFICYFTEKRRYAFMIKELQEILTSGNKTV